MSRLIIGQITIKKERAISSTKWYYLLQPANASAPDATNYGNPPPTISTTGYSGWSETEPSYTVGSDKKLYQMVLTIYTDGTFEYSTPSLSSSYEASKAAYNEIIQAEQDIQVLEDLGLKQGYIWDNPREVAAHDNIPIYPVGSYIASGILVNGNRSITQANSNTYGLNTWISTGGIKLRYNAINLAELNTSNLNFYYPSTSQQGNKAISLGTIGAINKLVFYDFSEHPIMELSSDGMELFKYINNYNTSIAKFGSSIRIGNYADNHAYVSSNGFFVYTANDAKIRIALGDSNGSPYAQIGSTLDTHYLYLSSSGLSLLTKTTGDDSHKSSLFVGLDGTAPFTRIGRVDDGHISIYSSGAEIFRKISTDTTPVSVGYFGISNGSPWARLGAYAEDHINIDGISHGIEIFKKESTDSNPVSVAWFGATSRIGQSDSLYTQIAPAQIDFYDGSESSTISLVRFTPNAFRLGAEGGARVLVQRGTYNGLEVFNENNTSIAWFGTSARIGASNSGRVTITSDGIEIFRKLNTDTSPVKVATFGSKVRIGAETARNIYIDGTAVNFMNNGDDLGYISGTSARFGSPNSSRFIIGASSLQAYSTTGLYFSVSASGITYGNNIAVASTNYVATAKSEAINEARLHADNYLSYDTSNGMTLSYNGLNSKVNIKGDGMRLYDSNGYISGFFGTNNDTTMIRIGRLDEDGHIYMQPSLFGIYNASETVSYVRITPTFARIGAPSVDGNVTVSTTDGFSIYNAGQTKSYVRIKNDSDTNTAIARIGAIANGESRTEIRSSGIDFISRNSSGTDVNLVHLGYASGQGSTSGTVAPYYSFGTRKSGTVGNFSFSRGENVLASGWHSHAEGMEDEDEQAGTFQQTEARGTLSYAYGSGTISSGYISHSIGVRNTASSSYSLAYGQANTISGNYSAGIGFNLNVTKAHQVVVGSYNNPNTQENTTNYNGATTFFAVGCGTSSARKNALEVANDGIRFGVNIKSNINMTGSAANIILPTGYSIGTYKTASDTSTWMALIYGNSDGTITIGNAQATGISIAKPINALYKITTKEITVSAGSAGSQDSANYTLSGSELGGTGYVPVGIVGATSTASSIFAFNYYVVNSTTIRAGFRRTATTSADYTVTFRILWLKATSA